MESEEGTIVHAQMIEDPHMKRKRRTEVVSAYGVVGVGRGRRTVPIIEASSEKCELARKLISITRVVKIDHKPP